MKRSRFLALVAASLALAFTLSGSLTVIGAGPTAPSQQRLGAGAAAHHKPPHHKKHHHKKHHHKKPAGRKMALGVSMLPYDDQATYDKFVAASGGKAPAIWSMWSDWGGANAAFPTGPFLAHLQSKGTVPMIIWEPVDPANVNGTDYTYDRITAGHFDTYLKQWAQAAKASGHTVLLRFAQEMDGDWFPWSVKVHGNTPHKFVLAWQHIWNIFRGPHGAGATNVKFLWSPMRPCTCHKDLFPGDKYVDYVGFSAFNWGRPISKHWNGLEKVMAGRVKALGKLSHRPVIIAETGSTSKGGNKAAWIRDGYPAVYKQLPRVAAIVYFNVDMTSSSQPDWRLTTPSRAMTEYRRIVAQSKFQGRIK